MGLAGLASLDNDARCPRVYDLDFLLLPRGQGVAESIARPETGYPGISDLHFRLIRGGATSTASRQAGPRSVHWAFLD
jgi:hypothetical protein